MNENEVMNTEVVETAQEIAVKAGVDPRDFIGIGIGIGIAVGAQFAYRYAIKPGIKWVKDKIAKKKAASDEKVVNINEVDLEKANSEE